MNGGGAAFCYPEFRERSVPLFCHPEQREGPCRVSRFSMSPIPNQSRLLSLFLLLFMSEKTERNVKVKVKGKVK